MNEPTVITTATEGNGDDENPGADPRKVHAENADRSKTPLLGENFHGRKRHEDTTETKTKQNWLRKASLLCEEVVHLRSSNQG